MKASYFIFLLFFIHCTAQSPSPKVIQVSGIDIQSRFSTPEGAVRSNENLNPFAEYLRKLKLKAEGSQVQYYTGATKPNHNVYCAVLDQSIGTKDLHQCADAIMRLKADFHYERKEYDKIHFNFTNGHKVAYAKWAAGERIEINGNKTKWVQKAEPSFERDSYWKYLEQIFMYAGTASLSKELNSIPFMNMQIGDVLIQGGHPGHAVMVVDMAINHETNTKYYLLGQSYMPAQEFQILINPMDTNLSPWYELKEGSIQTPEWTFNSDDLKRF